MILKVQRYDEDQEWWILDNIRKISISKEFYHSGVPTVPDGMDMYIFDVRPSCDCDNTNDHCSDCVGYYILICRMEDDSEYAMAFDTLAYLLNDEGKTIEKIVANYQVFDSVEDK
jgi:hypothetical protein